MVTPKSGTDGAAIISPFWGIGKVLAEIRLELHSSGSRVIAWAIALWATALILGLALLGSSTSLPPPWTLLGLALVAALAERQSVWVSGNIEMSISFLPSVFTAVAFGPLAAMIVGATANLAILGRPYLKWVVYTPARALTGAFAGIAAGAVHATGASAFGAILVGTLVAAVTNLAADGFFNVGTLWARSTGEPRSFLRAIGPLFALAVPLYVPLVALLVYGYWAYSLWVVGAFLVSALAFQRLIHLYQEQREAVGELQAANERLARANISFASALVATLDARDRYTAGHSAAVAIYARDIAARMGLPRQQQELAHVCGLVHDIGKIGLPPGLLEKIGPMSLEERRQMQTHAVIGERILIKVEDFAEIAAIVRHHHERWDGFGYPDGLVSEEIPVLSRILAVADAYNAMTSDRPYRDAMPSRVARFRLAQAADSQFDTTVVAAFEAILASADEVYRLAQREDFKFEVQEAIPSVVAAAG